MSNTLTYKKYTPITITTTRANTGLLLADLLPMFTEMAADATGWWTVAASSLGVAHPYIILKKKDNSPGRIFIIGHTTTLTVTNPEYRVMTGNGVVQTANPITVSTTSMTLIDAPNSIQDTLVVNPSLVLDSYTGMTAGTVNVAAALSSPTGDPKWQLFQTAETVLVAAAVGSSSYITMGAGNLLEDSAGNAVPSTLLVAADLASPTSPVLWGAPTGPFRFRVNGTIRNGGSVYAPVPSYITTVYDDTTTQKAVFIPFAPAVTESGSPDPDSFYFHRVRQMAYGKNHTVIQEQISDASGVIAIAHDPWSANRQTVWLTNFKI